MSRMRYAVHCSLRGDLSDLALQFACVLLFILLPTGLFRLPNYHHGYQIAGAVLHLNHV